AVRARTSPAWSAPWRAHAARTPSRRAPPAAGPPGHPPDAATALAGPVAALGRAEALAGNVADAFAALWQDLSLSRRLVAEDEGDALDAVLALSQAVTEASESADGSVAAFVASLDARGDAPDLARLRDSGADAVQVLTAHAAAGREFDTVIVAGAVEGEFPSLHRPEHMFDLGVLARRRSETERNVERLSDERRLFDLVVARARRGVLFTASQAGEEDGGSATSRFVDVPWEPAPDPAEDAPVSVADAVDRWRVDLADDGRDPADRLLALEGLLAIGERPDRWWLLHDWTEPPVPYTGPATLSFSRISALLDCELKFLLGAELGLDAPGGYHAWVGSLVHAVVEACERGDMPRSLDALRQAVAARWDRSQFPSTAIADANLHVALERMLPNWWNAYGRREPALAVEQPFRFEIDGVRFSGKIDRIEAVDPDDPDAGTRIIDYKTGKPKGRVTDQAPTEEHALQLLTYFVAANRDEALAAFRPVRSLEIAFLRGDDGASSIPASRTIDVPAEAHDATLADAEERLAGYVARIRAIAAEGTAAPTPSFSCRHCAFKMLCPAFQGRPSVPVERVGA
ncbi:MAG: PD-(D/E)XK nuclease family protein, partial [Actinomycetota bacterium]